MKNCHDDIVAYHNNEVTLRDKDRTDMRDRREANRKSLKSGLERDDEPKSNDNHSQGSYAMRTMVQQPDLLHGAAARHTRWWSSILHMG